MLLRKYYRPCDSIKILSVHKYFLCIVYNMLKKSIHNYNVCYKIENKQNKLYRHRNIVTTKLFSRVINNS